ncbi:MAG: magnesium/cobalt transporter CorA [Flavobacteriales bacterium]|nr:magnesium/cobalt transporter CorA [Bacteroidota bacterium]MCB9240728.1 magnesium/cobalt transporter CorA [Flavobacteriales bacterium]
MRVPTPRIPSLRIKRKPYYRQSAKSGLPPGTLVHIGAEREEPVTITYVRYNETEFTREEITLEQLEELKTDGGSIHWINVDGLTNPDVIARTGEKFNLPHLMLEDIMNTEHIPKVEVFRDFIFFTLKALHFNTNSLELDTEQVSFVLGRNYVLSFQERPENVYEGILRRMEEGKFKNRPADFLVYRLCDVIVDSYYQVLEHLEENIDVSEEAIFERPVPSQLQDIQSLKRVLLVLRKSIYPLREAINQLQKRDNDLIHAETVQYFKDLYDHTVHIVEAIETARDLNSGLKDIYLSSLSNKMNRVMQVLTIISTVFIPLSFITGLYGMNFDHMPELHWQNGYFGILAIMFAVTMVQLYFFRRKGWF